jgi:hypothetical protein
MNSNYSLKNIDDETIIARLKTIVEKNNHLTAVLLAHIAEVDARKLFLAAACSSMHTYCVEVLNFSESGAYKRIHAARAARIYPVIFDLVADGSIHLTAVTLLAPHLTSENHRELLEKAKRESKRAIEEMLASYFPKPDVTSVIRKLPSLGASVRVSSPVADLFAHRPAAIPTHGDASTVPAASVSAAANVETSTKVAADTAPNLVTASAATEEGALGTCPALEISVAAAHARERISVTQHARPAPKQVIAPLASDRFKVQFTASKALRDKLAQAQALLRREIPNGDIAEICDRALTLLVDDLLRKKFAMTTRPRRTKSAQQSHRRDQPMKRTWVAAARSEHTESDDKSDATEPAASIRSSARSARSQHTESDERNDATERAASIRGSATSARSEHTESDDRSDATESAPRRCAARQHPRSTPRTRTRRKKPRAARDAGRDMFPTRTSAKSQSATRSSARSSIARDGGALSAHSSRSITGRCSRMVAITRLRMFGSCALHTTRTSRSSRSASTSWRTGGSNARGHRCRRGQ